MILPHHHLGFCSPHKDHSSPSPIKATGAVRTMAPTTDRSEENVLELAHHDFVNHKCPMRNGNVCCRNMPNTARRHDGDLSAFPKAVTVREQLMQHIKVLSFQKTVSASPVWSSIQTNVGNLMSWTLCNKHLVYHDLAVSTTMESLKQECCPLVQGQSAQFYTNQATHTNPPAPQTTPFAPFSSYATAPTHLATPPASPANFQQEQMQQPFSGYPSNQPLNTQSFPTRSYAAPQQPPVVNGFSNPAYTAYAMNAQPPQQPQPGPFDSSAQSGFQVRPRTEMNFFGSQSTESLASSRFSNRGYKVEEPDGTFAPTPLSTPGTKAVYPHEQHYAPATAHQDPIDWTTQSKIDQLTAELTAVKINNKEFIQAYEQSEAKECLRCYAYVPRTAWAKR